MADRPRMTGHVWHCNKMHSRYLRLRNTLRVCNTSFFLVVAMVSRTRLNVTLYQHCLSCFCRSNRLFICRKSKGIVKSIDNTFMMKFTPWHTSACTGGRRRYSSNHSQLGRWMSAPRPSRLTPGIDPVPIVREAGWVTGSFWTGTENLASTRIRSTNRSSRSVSLCPPPRSTVGLCYVVVTANEYCWY